MRAAERGLPLLAGREGRRDQRTCSHAPDRRLRVLLVCMPWASLDMPSVAVSTLAPLIGGLEYVDRVDVLYANIDWADFLHRHTGGVIDQAAYRAIVDSYHLSVGEWIFTPALYGYREPEHTRFYAMAPTAAVDLAAPLEMYHLSERFVDELAGRVVAGGYHVVGFTSTFDQNIPSLALAARIKAVAPNTCIVMGGANCDGVQGAALHRNFPDLDYVVRGEGEIVVPRLLELLSRGGMPTQERASALAAMDGLCWRTGDGSAVVNRQIGATVPVAAIPEADVSPYFAQLAASESTADIRPKIQLEGGRGCWWGEKHHCTFCGLNGTAMSFRAKPADRLLAELERVVRQTRCLDVVFADNILDMHYVRDLMPGLAALDWDLRMFFETKSNLTFPQLRALSEAGITQLQPGIESLSTRVLTLMRKGVTAWQNVRFLRDCRTLAIFPGWNVLYGFPGERDADYDDLFDQLPNLVHLSPPEACNRLILTRYSPYFENRADGLVNLGPSALLESVYELPPGEVADIAYMFDSPDVGIGPAALERLLALHEQWRARHHGRRLVALADPEGIWIVDERFGDAVEDLLPAGLVADTFGLTLRGRPAPAIVRRLTELGHRADRSQVDELLAEWRRRGWLFRDGDYVVALPSGMGEAYG